MQRTETTTLSNPTIKQNGRTLTAMWELSVDGNETQRADLMVTHHGKAEYYGRPDKCYIAVLNRVTVQDRGNGIKMTRFTLYGGTRILREDAPRYNAKTQQEVLDRAIERVRELLEVDANVQDIFAV